MVQSSELLQTCCKQDEGPRMDATLQQPNNAVTRGDRVHCLDLEQQLPGTQPRGKNTLIHTPNAVEPQEGALANPL
jgi:hypothetical protein